MSMATTVHGRVTMDFFANEERAKRQTSVLVFYFVLAVIAIVFAVFGVCAAILSIAAGKVPHLSIELFSLDMFGKVATITLIVIGAGSFYKYIALGSGGAAIAGALGGRLVASNTINLDEKRLLNVVQEMAIASGVPVPDVYLLDGETGINAFAAGFNSGEAVIGVTHGAVTKLSRDELQGVIAHEFSHILNGDMRMNLRLIAALHGILLLSITGYIMVRVVTDGFGRSRNSSKSEAGQLVVILLLLGVALMIIGWIGAFFSRLIKAAISRQREFLADASAVQFTRNPGGLAGALYKIAGSSMGAIIGNSSAEQASHLFFGNGVNWTFEIFSTHPPIEQRIARILSVPVEQVNVHSGIDLGESDDPTPASEVGGVAGLVGGAAAAWGSGPTEVGAQPNRGIAASSLQGVPPHAMRADHRAIMATTGAPSREHLTAAAALMAELPHTLRDAASEPFGARAVVLALLLDADMTVRDRQLDAINRSLDATTYQVLEQLIPVADKVGARLRLVAVSLAMPALRALSPDQYAAFRRALEDVVSADDTLTLFEYAVQRMIRRNVESGQQRRSQKISGGSVVEDARLVLSAVAHMGGIDPVAVARNYEAAAAVFGLTQGPRPLTDCSFEAIDRALERLGASAGRVKEKFLSAAVASATADGFITIEEAEIVRAVADTLDCPIPPILPSRAQQF